ncbi:MAG: enoyl-CoA hydratase/isomerase family protein [Microthrixaceae bacterium]
MAAEVLLERRGAVLAITLSDPERLNAYDGATLKAIGAAGRELDDDADLRAGLITGAGGEFCSGADVAAVAAGGFDDAPYPELAEGIAAKPVVAAIEGRCLGGGMMIACGADLRLAAQSATFGLPEGRWNYPAQWLAALGRQVLPAHAMELALLADERLPAGRLAEMGWLNRVVSHGDALTEALAWAERLAALAPRALRNFKELIRAASWSDPGDALSMGHRHAVEQIAMADTAEGAAAFAEKRTPRFEDR